MSRPQYQQQLSSTDAVNRAGFPPPPPPPPPATSNGPGLAHRATTLRRGKTLTRPERQVAAAPLLTPPAPILPGAAQLVPANANAERLNWWIICSFVCTFWAPPSLLSACGLKDTATRQAWREKFALCTIAAVIGGIVAFLTMGLTRTLCPEGDNRRQNSLSPLGKTQGLVGIRGWAVNVSQSVVTSSVNFYDIGRSQAGQDITNLFGRSDVDYPTCAGFNSRFATTPLCESSSCPLPQLSAATLDSLKLANTSRQIGYSWANVSSQANFLVVDGNVLNLYPYLRGNPSPIPDDPVDAIIRTVVDQKAGGKDATRLFYSSAFPQKAVPCLVDRYYAGQIDKITPGCMLSTLFLFVSLSIILAVVFARFFMAWIFSWFISARMIRPPKHLSRSAVSPMVMPSAGAKFSVDAPGGTAPWRGGTVRQKPTKGGGGRGGRSANGDAAIAVPDKPAPLVTQTQIGAELFAVCLVTCYSESLESIKGTCDSLANTTYADGRKLLFIVADGMITGAGETVSTPDHCVGLLEADERFGNPLPMGYLAVGSGRKRENRAMVYAGHYLAGSGRDAHRVPTVVVVKCGMPFEASENKPGNRGKRDSQLILMNFFSRVTYNDRMSPLDFDLFRKIQVLTGVTPDFYEVCLMVDADTVVQEESLTHLVNVMHHDRLNMGVCGETRVANKTQSWVTLIQVYEYFISHHQAKAFESVFGGVTCLPGCFSMYRLKSRKLGDDDWIPIITNPDIIREYAQCEVSTLHQKNLLLLGEDRFLSTLMLRTFPNRKMLFCPQARCRTIVPDTFSVLLSQRRRWINSTIHNLMELLLVRNLCGTFCFSMQFVVFMDLIGTATLPVAICLTLALIINSIISPPQVFSDAIPLMLLAIVLLLPAFLVLLATGKVIYALWLGPYLLALPIWNFVLPVYSFWHFNDFTWGETRKVLGEVKGAGHADDKTALVASVPLRRWEDWERSRLRRIRREERRQRDLERLNRTFNNGNPRDDGGGSLAPSSRHHSEYDASDTASTLSSNEDDHWGPQIGAYNENNTLYPPPPLQFGADVDSDGEVLDGSDLEAMLDQGFDDGGPALAQRGQTGPYSALGSSSSLAHLPNGSTRTLAGPSLPRFALNDGPPAPPPPTRAGGYANTHTYTPLANPRHSPPELLPKTLAAGQAPAYPTSTTTAYKKAGGGHAKQRSISSPKNHNWGPGGPLMAPPADHIQASRS